MSAYVILTYNISDPGTFQRYIPGSLPIINDSLARHGGELLAADHESRVIAGEPREVVVVLRFPSTEAAAAWDSDAGYAPAKAIRLGSTSAISAYIAAGLK